MFCFLPRSVGVEGWTRERRQGGRESKNWKERKL